MTSLLTRPQNLQLFADLADTFDVRSFEVTEGLNSLFSVDIVARCANPAVDLEEAIGKSAAFRIETLVGAYGDAPAPLWSGIVADIEQTINTAVSHTQAGCTRRIETKIKAHAISKTKAGQCNKWPRKCTILVVETVHLHHGGSTCDRRPYGVGQHLLVT